MKILLVNNSLNMGGIETNILRLSKYFLDEGHIVHVVSSGGVLVKDIEEIGAFHHRAPIKMSNFVKCAFDLSNILKTVNPDVIHLFSATSCFCLKCTDIANLFFKKFHCKAYRVSSVMGLQNSPDESPFITQFRNYLHSLAVDTMIVTSPVIKQMCESIPFINKKKIRFQLVCGVLMPELSDASSEKLKAELEVHPDEKMVITIGALQERKSHELFIEAASHVLKKRKNIKFFIAGEGQLKDKLAQCIDVLNVNENVKLLGLRKDVYNLLRISDLCVKPGIVNGFIGITVLEAQSLKVPVVAFYTEDVLEAIVDCETGFITHENTSKSLADRILYVLDQKEKASLVTENAYKVVKEKFSLEAVAMNLLQLYFNGNRVAN